MCKGSIHYYDYIFEFYFTMMNWNAKIDMRNKWMKQKINEYSQFHLPIKKYSVKTNKKQISSCEKWSNLFSFIPCRNYLFLNQVQMPPPETVSYRRNYPVTHKKGSVYSHIFPFSAVPNPSSPNCRPLGSFLVAQPFSNPRHHYRQRNLVHPNVQYKHFLLPPNMLTEI